MPFSLSPARLVGALVALAVVFFALGQLSWPIAILVTLFAILVVPFMAAIFSEGH